MRFHLSSTLPEDYDLEILRKNADGSLHPVGASGNVPGEDEDVLLAHPQPGTYVARVVFYAAVTGAYELRVNRVTTTRTTTSGTKEAYELTCEEPGGAVLERHSLVIDRGQSLGVRLGCGTGTSTFEDGTPLAGTPDAPLPTRTPSIDGVVAPLAGAGAAATPSRARLRLTAARTARPSRSGAVRVSVACPAAVASSCRGTLRLRGTLDGRRLTTLGSRAFTVRSGRGAKVSVRLTRTARRALTRRIRMQVTATVSGRAGATALSGTRKLTLRRR